MTAKSVDRSVPVQQALVLHPDRARREDLRAASARLTEAIGLAEALDLKVVETRIAPRYRVMKPEDQYGGEKIARTIRDLSTTGAALEVPDPSSSVPQAFTLMD